MIDKETLKGAIGAEYQKSPWDGKGISMPPPEAPVQEPVAWMSREDYDDYLEESKVTSATVYNYQLDIPLYTTPPAAQRQWVGLTDDEFEDIELGCRSTSSGKIMAMQKVEAKLKEKNT